jgi:hypothetical protein
MVLYNLTFPANINAFFAVLISAATFDIVPFMDEINEFIFKFKHTLEVLEMKSQGFE